MVIETKKIIECDTCGKRVETKIRYEPLSYLYLFRNKEVACVPEDWYFLNSINVEIGKRNWKKTSLFISDCNDPHFCCKKCLMIFLDKALEKASKGKKIKQK